MELAYFKHFELPISLNIDVTQLKSKFYTLSKKYHPDFYLNESKEKQEEILALSTLTNKAYQTLSNPDLLLAYLLKESGVMEEGEKDSLPLTFLTEMMDFNEDLVDLELDFEEIKWQKLQNQLQKMILINDQEMNELLQDFSIKSDEEQRGTLQKVKENFYKKKYFLRIQKKVFIFASR